MNLFKIKNLIFFANYLILNPQLILLYLTKNIYIPVYVQYDWLKKYDFGTVIDIGANIGRTAQTFNYLFPKAKLFAFEPNKSLSEEIRKRVTSKNLILETVALNDKVGKTILQIYPNHALSSILPFTKPGEEDRKFLNIDAKKSKVETTTLDKYFKNKNLRGNIFLKIDTEGSEGLILKGGKNFLKKVAVIHIETYFNKLYEDQSLFSEIYDFLKSEGFTYYGEAKESIFYPSFSPNPICNSLFINRKILRNGV